MENRFNIGELDTMVTLQSRVEVVGTQGQRKYLFSDFRKVWAKVDWSTMERVSEDNLEAGRSVTLTIHKVPELTTRWRVIIDTIPYEIVSINPISRVSPVCEITCNTIDG